MKPYAATMTLCLILAPLAALAGPPDVEDIRNGAIEAAGGMKAFKELGVIEIALKDEETTSDGKQHTKTATAYVDARTMVNMRLELPGNIVIARTGTSFWATRNGEMDDRPQAPKMVRATLNQRLFPLLLPYTLDMDGITLSNPTSSNFEGEPAWRVAVDFPDDFFVAPSMATTWYLHVRKSDFKALGVEFIPPQEVRTVRSEGIRYRPLKWMSLGSGVQIPVQVLLDGIDVNGAATGHVRVTRMGVKVRGAYEPALFIDPIRLQQIEESME
jgi:hypothetical protein